MSRRFTEAEIAECGSEGERVRPSPTRRPGASPGQPSSPCSRAPDCSLPAGCAGWSRCSTASSNRWAVSGRSACGKTSIGDPMRTVTGPGWGRLLPLGSASWVPVTAMGRTGASNSAASSPMPSRKGAIVPVIERVPSG